MNLELIHKYLNKEMTMQEHAAFELSLLKDSELAEEVALQKDMISFSGTDKKAIVARQTILEIGETYRIKSEKKEDVRIPPTKSRLRYIIPISIAALFLIGFFISQTFISKEMSPEKIYAQYATVSNVSFANRSHENDERLLSAQNAFNSKDYPLAISAFEKIISTNPNNAKAVFYQGYAKINAEDIEGGREDLRTLLENPQYKNSAAYQLGLSYIKTQENDQAISILQTIESSSNHYKKAQELVNMIR